MRCLLRVCKASRPRSPASIPSGARMRLFGGPRGPRAASAGDLLSFVPRVVPHSCCPPLQPAGGVWLLQIGRQWLCSREEGRTTGHCLEDSAGALCRVEGVEVVTRVERLFDGMERLRKHGQN